ncbi:MAG: dTMP kinase [Chloroflexi bacterium]|nr:dTMP kinase [Chloroflexota bacterium]
MTRGLFITFEGGEASGKSVQAQALIAWLRARDRTALLVHEPGSTPLGERVRDIVLHAKDVPLTPQAQALLFSTARAQLVHDVIAPALAAGTAVVADRFYHSTLVYQGYVQDADPRGLRAITDFAVGETRPDRTFVLDVPVATALERRAHETGRPWDRFEAGKVDFHEKVREGYLALAREDPGHLIVVNGDRDQLAIEADIRRSMEELLGVPSRP